MMEKVQKPSNSQEYVLCQFSVVNIVKVKVDHGQFLKE
jgi:hypothetical protein